VAKYFVASIPGAPTISNLNTHSHSLLALASRDFGVCRQIDTLFSSRPRASIRDLPDSPEL